MSAPHSGLMMEKSAPLSTTCSGLETKRSGKDRLTTNRNSLSNKKHRLRDSGVLMQMKQRSDQF